MDYMKHFHIKDFKEFNKGVSKEFEIDERNIHELILIDYWKGIYYYYNHHQMFSEDSIIKKTFFDIKGSMIPKLNNIYLIEENKFNQILELKHSYVRGYFKSNFLKLFNLEEFII